MLLAASPESLLGELPWPGRQFCFVAGRGMLDIGSVGLMISTRRTSGRYFG